MPQKFKYGLI